MKLRLTLFIFLLFITNKIFSQNDSIENVVLLSYDAYANKKNAANFDTLKIGDDIKDSVLVQKGGYLCLMNEKGYLVEYHADKEDKKYKIKHTKNDNLSLNAHRSRIEVANFWININTNQERRPCLFSKTDIIHRYPNDISILAEIKSEILFDTTVIFLDYSFYKSTYEYQHRYDDEDTIFTPKNVHIEISDIRNNSLYKSSLDNNFFIFTWDLVNKDSSDRNNIAIYKFVAQDNKGKELKSGTYVLREKRKELNTYEEYLTSDSNTNFDNFLKAILAANNNAIYFPTFRQKFMKDLPQNAHQSVPNTNYDFAVYFDFQIR
ncbi:hypothetical protein WAF17_04220 [Bernardetia sp. ABR2-2B]|uniref:hypothetical protein n=1 Tax=Bernardetia sp. ABR2-2B TaxID=3127472 RepID=UPI0030D14A2F